jgi:hypothetical protein
MSPRNEHKACRARKNAECGSRKPCSALLKARVCFAGNIKSIGVVDSGSESAGESAQSYAGPVVVKKFNPATLQSDLHLI